MRRDIRRAREYLYGYLGFNGCTTYPDKTLTEKTERGFDRLGMFYIWTADEVRDTTLRSKHDAELYWGKDLEIVPNVRKYDEKMEHEPIDYIHISRFLFDLCLFYGNACGNSKKDQF
ncbi:hypothetical protein BJH44_004277 [Salmonella enterica subsp. enterica serovar Bredeney]|uniref:hypothetical protein n=1 Tax=Salmonella enterica TaxID=28901 RepID=UPI0009AD311D|nr:hypothetical protein [Salmonella enterica]EDV7203292.1 hypothetical protein [Salmonella enterica subsp. enterica serovar Bredeney]